MQFEDLNDEIDVHIEPESNGKYVARVFHKLSRTIKISSPCDSPEEATKEAVEGLLLLLAERMKGLGK